LGAHALLNVNHSYHVDLRAYAPHVDLGVDAPALILRVYAPALILGVYAPALLKESLLYTLIGTTCILHSQVVIMSLHCRQC